MKAKKPSRKARVLGIAVLAFVTAGVLLSTSAYSSGTWSNLFPPKGKFALVGTTPPLTPELGGGPQPIDEGGPLIITEGP